MKKPEVSPQERQAQETRYRENNARIDAIVRPLTTARWGADYAWSSIEKMLADFERDYGLNLHPDFQRGHVWSKRQQEHFIENVFRGVVTQSGLLIQFNAPHWDDDRYQGDIQREMQCLDGLQRLTAVRAYMAGEVKPFGMSNLDFAGTRYCARRGHQFHLRIAVHTFQTRRELLQYYLDINDGGTQHSATELERVRALRDTASAPCIDVQMETVREEVQRIGEGAAGLGDCAGGAGNVDPLASVRGFISRKGQAAFDPV